MFAPLSAVAFLEHEAGALRDALARPGDGRRVVRALRLQNRAHTSWLCLIATARQAEHFELADEVVRLYEFHGRLAGTLERGFDPLLDPVMEQRLRMLLIARLQRLTSRAVEQLIACSVPSTAVGAEPHTAPSAAPS